MNLKNLNDNELLVSAKKHRQLERKAVTRMLGHIEEISRRRLFSDLSYKSIYEYCEKELGYSADQAFRRISACRLIREIPKAKNMLETGELNLTNASKLYSHFESEAPTEADKFILLDKIRNKTTREGERIIAEYSKVDRIPNEYERPIKNGRVQITFSLREDIYKRLKEMKSLHNVYKLEDLLIKFLEEKPEKNTTRNTKIIETKGRYIPSMVREQVKIRDNNQCNICASKSNLEFDHTTPYSMGGNNTVENIRLLCRSCNQRQAIKIIGDETMDRYIG